MFEGATLLSCDKRKHGQKVAMEIVGDIHEYTELYSPKDSVDVPYLNARQLLDFNEHFIELGTPVQGRSFVFMVLCVFVLAVLISTSFLLNSIFSQHGLGSDAPRWLITSIASALFGFVGFAVGAYWYIFLRGFFFTALTARYRFNRTTGKVYVVRPQQFGGNAVLDWERVRAHPRWCTPTEVEPGYQHDPVERNKRKAAGGGPFMRKGLVLYWPPLDPEDPQRKGEDIIWVGDWLSDGSLWEYIRVFMEEGVKAVPVPEPDEYRRKGRSSMWQHLWEEQFDSIVREAKLRGNPNPKSAVTFSHYLQEVPFLPFNSMAQWLCWWPTFPEEWNSDCGQKRRDSGIGPEEPLRWKADA